MGEGVYGTVREEQAARAAVQCIAMHPAGFAQLDRAQWLALEPELATQLLADLLRSIGGNIHRPRRDETLRLAQALRDGEAKRTLAGCCIRNGERVVIEREFSRVAAPVLLQGSGCTRWDDRFTVHYEVERQVTLAALGHAGRRTLRAHGIDVRDLPLATPALWHLEKLLGMPHITGADMPVRLGFSPGKPLAAAAFW